jgi:hypothetical protein
MIRAVRQPDAAQLRCRAVRANTTPLDFDGSTFGSHLEVVLRPAFTRRARPSQTRKAGARAVCSTGVSGKNTRMIRRYHVGSPSDLASQKLRGGASS